MGGNSGRSCGNTLSPGASHGVALMAGQDLDAGWWSYVTSMTRVLNSFSLTTTGSGMFKMAFATSSLFTEVDTWAGMTGTVGGCQMAFHMASLGFGGPRMAALVWTFFSHCSCFPQSESPRMGGRSCPPPKIWTQKTASVTSLLIYWLLAKVVTNTLFTLWFLLLFVSQKCWLTLTSKYRF